MNCITYKEFFPLIKDNKVWLEIPFPKENAYFSPATQNDYSIGMYGEEANFVKFRNETLPLMAMAYNLRLSKHQKLNVKTADDRYDNYDVIEVPFRDVIISDFDGIIGASISLIAEKFKIFSGNRKRGYSNGLHVSSYRTTQYLSHQTEYTNISLSNTYNNMMRNLAYISLLSTVNRYPKFDRLLHIYFCIKILNYKNTL